MATSATTAPKTSKCCLPRQNMHASTAERAAGDQMHNSFESTDRIPEIAEKEAGAEGTREFRIFGPP